MRLLNAIRNALGLTKPLVVEPLEPLTLTPPTLEFLNALEPGRFFALSTSPKDGMYSVHVSPCSEPGSGPAPHPSLHISEEDSARFHGLCLDFRDGKWKVLAHLRVNASETPNPNGRRYQTNRIFHEGQPAFFTTEHGSPPLARKLLESSHIVSTLFRGNEIIVERMPSSDWSEVDREVDERLRQSLLQCAPIVKTPDVPTFNTELERKVWRVIQEDILPAMQRDGGDLQLLGVSEGIVRVTLRGACASCPASALTLNTGIEKKLIDTFPTEIVRVEAI